MFPFRANRLLLFNGDFTITSTLPCFLITPFRFRSTSTHCNSFTVSYLIDSCGLSEEKAISISKKVRFQSSTKPDSVLTLFKHYEFPHTHISKIVQKRPLLLLANADKTLKPKLDFFNSIGLSGLGLANVLASDPDIFKRSLEKSIIPSIEFIKRIVLTDTNVITVFKRSTWILRQDPKKRLAPNIIRLQTHGVPDRNILKLLLCNAKPLLRTDRLNQIVEEINGMKFDPRQYLFVQAIIILASLSKSSWELKLSIYKRWGWSEGNILTAFKIHPQCMMLSVKKIMGIMEFVVNKMGYDPLLFARYPSLLTYSLEKRITPRLSVIQVLISNGLVEKPCNVCTVLTMNNENFLKKFVIKFEEKVPQLLSVYQGKMECPLSTH